MEEEIKLIDIEALTPPKKRGRPAKKKTSTEPATEVDAVKLLSEKDRLKADLLRLSDYNPEVVTRAVNDKLAKLVEEMNLDELRERVRIGKRNQSSKMDNSVAVQTINLTNQVVGRFLGCLEELNESTIKDRLLQETLKDYLCLNVLDYIPPEIKIGGLYGSHVVSAYGNKPPPPPPQIQEITPEIKSKLSELREKFEALGPVPSVVE